MNLCYVTGAVQHQQSRSMFIQTSTTPNPASLMFIPGKKVMEVRLPIFLCRTDPCTPLPPFSGAGALLAS